jgi:hypothetical protein
VALIVTPFVVIVCAPDVAEKVIAPVLFHTVPASKDMEP